MTRGWGMTRESRASEPCAKRERLFYPVRSSVRARVFSKAQASRVVLTAKLCVVNSCLVRINLFLGRLLSLARMESRGGRKQGLSGGLVRRRRLGPSPDCGVNLVGGRIGVFCGPVFCRFDLAHFQGVVQVGTPANIFSHTKLCLYFGDDISIDACCSDQETLFQRDSIT